MGVSMSETTPPEMYDHLRTTDAEHTPGVYRVVGTDEDTVTLLRVADAEGQRANTGAVVTVEREALSGFEPADNPDGNRPLGARVSAAATNTVWSFRAFGRSLAANPLPSALALALMAVGTFGEGVVPVGDTALVVALFAGALGLSYIGSGRL